MPRGLSPLQCNEIERQNSIPDACLFMNPTLHFCPSWQMLLIDNSDPEYNNCKCKENKRGHIA